MSMDEHLTRETLANWREDADGYEMRRKEGSLRDEPCPGCGRTHFPWCLTPAQQIIANAPEELDNLMHAVATVDRWLDGDVAPEYKDQPLAQDWARVAKEAEEKGESIAELIAATGQNPRKGRDPAARDRLVAELADRAATCIFAIQHFTKDEAATWHAVTAAIGKAYDRAPGEYR